MQMMKPVAYVLPLLLLAACGEKSGDTPTATGPVVAVKAPAGTEWVTTVVETPSGGMQMGNPNAPIKIVEYGSLSCSHCAEFSEKSAEPLKANYISTGKVSYEFRNYVRDPMDLAATLLARCGGPGPFFPLAEQMFADQHNWFEKLKTVPVAEQQAIGALTPAEQMAKYATLLGFDNFVRQRGISAEKAKACLANAAESDKLVKMRDRANTEFNLQVTPTFIINGQTLSDTASWEQLEAKLKAAGA
jgi:protein-disulfide isomerase